MRIIEAYEVDDGTRFFNRDVAEKYEVELVGVKAILPPDARAGGDGASYYQHAPGTRATLIAAAQKAGYQHPRYADDAITPWKTVWWRITCMDMRDREWGQPYFAINPNPKATAVNA